MTHLAASLNFNVGDPAFWLPLVLALLLFFTVLAGAVLDGFDIGVGCLVLVAPTSLRPRMLSLLSPWRDANELWLFLGLALFAVAFPQGWAAIMGQVGTALLILAIGTVARSVCFEFRLRAPTEQQPIWLIGFALGSIATAFSHGLLLGAVVINFEAEPGYNWFVWFMGFCALAAYALIGATWLLMREKGELRFRAVGWGRRAVRWFAAGVVAASVVLSLANPGVLLKWSEGTPRSVVLMLWLGVLVGFIIIEMRLQRLLNVSARSTAVPFIISLVIFIAVLVGLGFSFFPFMVLDQVTLWDAAAETTTLYIVAGMCLVAAPFLGGFFLWVYWRVFGLSKAPLPPKFKR